MTPHLKQELLKFERYKEQFKFLQVNGIETAEQLAAFRTAAEERLAALTKQRTILNVQKKKRKAMFDALAAAEALLPAKLSSLSVDKCCTFRGPFAALFSCQTPSLARLNQRVLNDD